MHNYKLIIQYEGTKYSGWQTQGNTGNTIQNKIETVLSKLCEEEIEIHGSGRTDAGTHAKGQVANFKTKKQLKNAEIVQYLNMYLPKDIAVISADEVPLKFHSRLNAKDKTYSYHIWNSEIPNVFERKMSYQIEKPLDIEKMKSGARFLKGEHDFKSFCANKKMKKSTVRTIYDIDIIKDKNMVNLHFTGNGFLYQMVRIMTGTLIEIGLGNISPDEIVKMLDMENREAAGPTAPSLGLTLEEVNY